jgi:hypothetical protein
MESCTRPSSRASTSDQVRATIAHAEASGIEDLEEHAIALRRRRPDQQADLGIDPAQMQAVPHGLSREMVAKLTL